MTTSFTLNFSELLYKVLKSKEPLLLGSRQQIYKNLEQECPMLKQYKKMEDKRAKLTGLAADQADKTILNLVKTILADKGLQARLVNDSLSSWC